MIFSVYAPDILWINVRVHLSNFSFTLDSLITKDNLFVQAAYIVIVSIAFFFGTITSICSLDTFGYSKPRKIGVVNCLLTVPQLNTVSLIFLLSKIVYIYMESSQYLVNHPTTNTILCKTVSYLVSISTRGNYWLLSWVAVERLSFAIFAPMSALHKPSLAIRISIITVIVVFGMHIHEPLFSIIVQNSIDKIICTDDHSQSYVAAFNRVGVFMHYLVPFFVQILSITLIIVFVARNRAKTVGLKKSFGQILKHQFLAQK